MGDFATVNGIYGKYFPENPPARATFAVKTLPLNAKVRARARACHSWAACFAKWSPCSLLNPI